MSFANYAAGAIIAPYGKFLRAAEEHRYAIDRLCANFGVNVEQVAHRLTTLGRSGAKGVPFLETREKAHFLRVEAHEWQTARDQLLEGHQR